MDKPTVHIYTDGGCKPNPGVGGWAAVLVSPGNASHRKELSGAEPDSTNNRMELTAAIMALRAITKPSKVVMFTDSQYLRNAFEQKWLVNWQKKNWRTASNKPVLNVDLWKELLLLTATHEVSWKWVRGHADNAENNRCDELATRARVAHERGERV